MNCATLLLLFARVEMLFQTNLISSDMVQFDKGISELDSKLLWIADLIEIPVAVGTFQALEDPLISGFAVSEKMG